MFFCTVYDRDKKPVQILNELLALYPATEMPPLYIVTSFNTILQTYHARVQVGNMASLSSNEFTEEGAKQKVQMMAFYFLKDLSSLIGKMCF